MATIEINHTELELPAIVFIIIFLAYALDFRIIFINIFL